MIQITATTNGSSTSSPTNSFFVAFRWILAAIFPNVTIKRAIFDLKVSNNSFCLTSLNTYLYSKLLYFTLFAKNLNYIYNSFLFFKADYQANTPLYLMSEPGIGIFLIISISQLVFFTIILFLIEFKLNIPS